MDIEKYTRNTYKHVPRGYENTASTIYKLLEKNNNNAVDCIFDASTEEQELAVVISGETKHDKN